MPKTLDVAILATIGRPNKITVIFGPSLVRVAAFIRSASAYVNHYPENCLMFPPNKEAEMRVIIPTLVGLVALAAVSAQAAPNPSNAYPHGKWHETPAQNVWKSQQYDYLLRTNGNFRAYSMKKECGPIRDPGLRGSCIASFSAYEPVRR